MSKTKLFDTGQPMHEWFGRAADAAIDNVKNGLPPTIYVEIHGVRFELTAKRTLPLGKRDDVRIQRSGADLMPEPPKHE